jgi:hypothetical protein
LLITAALEVVAALRAEEVWWALCAAPLLLASLIVARTIKGRKQVIDDLTFQSELYVGPHSPWAPHAPDSPTQ